MSVKIRFFTTWTGDLKWCVFFSHDEKSLTFKFELNTAILDFGRFDVRINSIFQKLCSDTSNSAFCPSYGEGILTCKFKLNAAIFDFDRFEVRINPIFQNTSRRPQLVRFVLVTLWAA